MKKPFIHLRSLSSYSLSESTLKIKKLVNLAKKNNMPALLLLIIIICLVYLNLLKNA